jgi:serine protease Do
MADGRPIRSAAQLRNTIGLARIGDQVKLTVERSGGSHNVIVAVGPSPEATNASVAALI